MSPDTPRPWRARDLADMQGAFEVRPCTGRGGRCLRQMAPVRPLEWRDDSDAFTLVGDTRWTDVTLTVDARPAKPGTVELLGRVGEQARPQSLQDAYAFRVSDTGAWALVITRTDGTRHVLAHGTTRPLGVGRWHRMSFALRGDALSVAVDGRSVGSVHDRTWSSGQRGLGIAG